MKYLLDTCTLIYMVLIRNVFLQRLLKLPKVIMNCNRIGAFRKKAEHKA